MTTTTKKVDEIIKSPKFTSVMTDGCMETLDSNDILRVTHCPGENDVTVTKEGKPTKLNRQPCKQVTTKQEPNIMKIRNWEKNEKKIICSFYFYTFTTS